MRLPGRRRDAWWLGWNVPLWTAAVATSASIALYAAHRDGLIEVPGLEAAELDSLDARFQLRGARPLESDAIVIVGIDDKTRAEAPQVFQSRRGWAELIDAVAAYEPRAVGVDAFFAAPEVALSPQTMANVREAYNALDAMNERPPPMNTAMTALGAVIRETRGDELLADAIARAGTIYLGALFVFPEPGETAAPVSADAPPGLARARYGEVVTTSVARERRLPAARYVIGSLAPIANGAAGGGAVNVISDMDGQVRRAYGVLEYAGQYFMPLGMSMALAQRGGGTSYVTGATTIRAGDHTLPASGRGELMLSYLGPGGTFPHVSAADVIARRTPDDALAGKLVFIGYTEKARDKVVTPFDSLMAGVEVHATLTHNILHDELLCRTSSTTTLLTLALLGALFTLLQLRRIRRRRAWVAGAAALAMITVYLIVAHLLFIERGLVVEVAAPIGSCALITVMALVATLVTEGREKAQLKSAFSQYVADTLVERVLADPDRATLGGERRELTVLFSDIRGFSRFAENLEPEALSEYLNEYFTPMTQLVMNDGGMLDKYIGDAIMAVYGAPIDMTDHAERACRTALAMTEVLAPLNERWRRRDMPEIAIGVGLNSGPMAVGNMGSEARFDYTVLGDAVNLGARLEGLTKEYRVTVLVGESTARGAGSSFTFRELDWVRVKGRDGAVRIYELVGPRDKCRFSDGDLALFADALAAYRDRDWDGAEQLLTEFAARHPGDGPAQVLMARLATMRALEPDDDWDGVFAQQSK